MPSQVVLEWDVDVSGSPIGPAGAAARLAAVVLYSNANTDPVLGQLFGLTVDSDVTSTPSATTARRTLTLNMDGSQAPAAPPPFPCAPRTSTPPVLPYPLREAVTLPGSFAVSAGSATVPTTASQIPSLVIGDSVQFLSQKGVFYAVASVGANSIGLTGPYTGKSGSTGAFKEVEAPVTVAALFSTSELDTVAVATVPPIAAGPGARTVEVSYNDSTGASFTSAVDLNGKCPVNVPLAMGSVDIAEITNIVVTAVGAFENSIGQITLVELSSAVPALPPNTPLGTGIGPTQTDQKPVLPAETFKTFTDEAQLLILRGLAYIPPSYFALAAQSSSQATPAIPPTNAQLSGPLGQFVATETAAPPPDPPLPPATVPTPTFLAGLFARTLQLAVSGVRITSQTITFI